MLIFYWVTDSYAQLARFFHSICDSFSQSMCFFSASMWYSSIQCAPSSQPAWFFLSTNVLLPLNQQCFIPSTNLLPPLNQPPSFSQPTNIIPLNQPSSSQPTHIILLNQRASSPQPKCFIPSSGVLPFSQPTSSFLSPTVPHPPNQRRILSRCHPTQEPPPKAYKDLCFCEVHQHPRIKKAVLECIFLFFSFFPCCELTPRSERQGVRRMPNLSFLFV